MANLATDTLPRQWQTLRLIPRYPLKITAGELHQKLLAEQFEVTKRTVERDLQSLSELFPLTVDEREKPYGWSWGRDAQVFNLPGLSHTEALTLAMVEQHLNSLLPASTLQQLQPHFNAARQHLNNIPKNQAARSWLNKVRTVSPSQPLLSPNIDPQVQQTVYEALLSDRQLQIRYLGRGQTTAAERRIHPVALILRGHISYLSCRMGDYQDLRTLALHRIQSAQLLADKADPPADFSIDAEISSGKFGFGSQTPIDLELVFYHGAGEHLFETPLCRNQTLSDLGDGSLKLTAHLPHTQQLEWWLLGFGAGVEVVKPEGLREQMKGVVEAMAERYQSR